MAKPSDPEVFNQPASRRVIAKQCWRWQCPRCGEREVYDAIVPDMIIACECGWQYVVVLP